MNSFYQTILSFCIIVTLPSYPAFGSLTEQYQKAISTPSDINEHVATFRSYALEVDSVIECGVRSVVSSWGFLRGLVDAPRTTKKSLVCVDLKRSSNVDILEKEATAHGIDFKFVEGNDLTVPLKPADIVFIDTWHIYGHLKRELARFKYLAHNYIMLHDTTIDAIQGETIRNGWNAAQQSIDSGYPIEEINKGVWPAVQEFLAENPEWVLHQKYDNNSGLTILKKVGAPPSTSIKPAILAPRDKKLLILIIASDDQEAYVNLQKLWAYQMNLNPSIEAYFIKGDPTLSTPHRIDGTTIWLKVAEGLVPAILHKTIMSLNALSSRLDEFSHILRTNLSSFYIFDRLLPVLDRLPKERCYAAVQGMHHSMPFGSGAGFIISPDLARLLLQHKSDIHYHEMDDVAVGEVLYRYHIPLIQLPRFDVYSVEEWDRKKHTIGDDTFHIRIKNEVPEPYRSIRDTMIRKELLYMFYKIIAR